MGTGWEHSHHTRTFVSNEPPVCTVATADTSSAHGCCALCFGPLCLWETLGGHQSSEGLAMSQESEASGRDSEEPPSRSSAWEHPVLIAQTFLKACSNPSGLLSGEGAHRTRILAWRSSEQISVGVKFKNCVEVLFP